MKLLDSGSGDPMLGKVAAAINMLGMVSFLFLLFNTSVRRGHLQFMQIYFAVVLGAAFVVGAVAMARKRSRTNLAKLSFGFSLVICFFCLKPVLFDS